MHPPCFSLLSISATSAYVHSGITNNPLFDVPHIPSVLCVCARARASDLFWLDASLLPVNTGPLAGVTQEEGHVSHITQENIQNVFLGINVDPRSGVLTLVCFYRKKGSAVPSLRTYEKTRIVSTYEIIAFHCWVCMMFETTPIRMTSPRFPVTTYYRSARFRGYQPNHRATDYVH